MIRWRWLTYQELLPQDLELILRVRQEVFVIEQECIYQDIDGLDSFSQHLLGFQRADPDSEELVAYLRVVAPGKRFREPSIGRVLTTQPVRSQGVGRQLMHQGVMRTSIAFPNRAIRISAQSYLERFYRGFGFDVVSAPYDEDGIPHIEMLRDPGTTLS